MISKQRAKEFIGVREVEKSQNENGEERVPDQCVVIQLVSHV